MVKRILAHDGAGFNTLIDNPRAHDGGGYVNVNRVYANDGSEWNQIWPGDDVIPLPPGVYSAPRTALFIGSSIGQNSFAEFDTTAYRGRITEIRARISWNTSATQFANSGRPNSNFYRNIGPDGTWNGRTIDHRIDTFDATSLTDFNSGAAIGYNMGIVSGSIPANINFTNLHLRLTIA